MPPLPNMASESASAVDFLRSISADASVTFGASSAAAASSKTAPELPISAKVSLIDAQIDNLEGQIQSTIQTHSEQIKQRTASSRTVQHNLTDLWQSINQTSSRLVAVPSGVIPHAAQYHDALAQSQKQALLISFLSDLVSVLKQLEELETMLDEGNLAGSRDQMPVVEARIHPILEQTALQKVAALVELQNRFQRIRARHIILFDAAQKPPDKAISTIQESIDPVPTSAPTTFNVSEILDTARKVIIAKGAEKGWKAVVVASPHPRFKVVQPIVEVESKIEDPALPETHPVVPMREGLVRAASPLTRSSSNSSGVTARRQKAKLGARVLRPQDQLGNGPFNAQDAAADGSDWNLDDDGDDDYLPTQPSEPTSITMHTTSSNSSLQRAALAMQHEDDGDEAWGLEEEPSDTAAPLPSLHNTQSRPLPKADKSLRAHGDEDSAWGLDDDDAIVKTDATALPTDQIDETASMSAPHRSFSPSPTPSFTSAAQDAGDGEDAWGIEDDDLPQDRVSTATSEPDLATPLVSQYNGQQLWGADLPVAPLLQQTQEASPVSVPTQDEVWDLADKRQPAVGRRQSSPSTKGTFESAAEMCTISQRSIELVDLAKQTMDEGMRLLSLPNAEPDASKPEIVLATVGDIFELHRSLMPVAHGELLRDVPSLAMQFFNDCEYLARELLELVDSRSDAIAAAWTRRDVSAGVKWQEHGLKKLQQQVVLTQSLGQRWFEAQITAQSKVLLDNLAEADGFARTFDDDRFMRCERCVKQVVQTLEQLGKAWRSILAPSHFNPALGRLVDLVFQKVLHDVLDLEDIGESESEKLAGLIKQLGGLEALFTDTQTQQSSAPLFVPSWFKTSYLIEILTGSLVDIEFLAFEARALVDYSREELTGLIKALFSDTNNRSKLLHKIETAAPDILAR